jgi:hypothetical protein
MRAMDVNREDMAERPTLVERFLSSLAPGDQVGGERHFKQLEMPAHRDSLVRLFERLRLVHSRRPSPTKTRS